MIYNKFVRNIYFPLTEFVKGENVRKYLSSLGESQYYSRDEIREIQWQKLKNLLNHAYQNIPYYQDLFKKNGLNPDDINSPEDFTKFPLLTKEAIVEHHSEIIDTKYRGNIYPGKTSGSTGIPLKFYCTPEYSSWDWASRWRARNWFGVNIGDPEVAIWGRPLYSSVKKYIDPLKGRLRNTLLISGFEYSEEHLNRFSRKMLQFNPFYIYGYSNSIYQMAVYFKDQHLPPLKRLKAIFVTAETLLPQERALIESAFQAPVSNEYGCSEIGGFAYECPAGRWHVSVENVYLEFIENENGVREVVGTSLTNNYMPFIRYRIGDIGEWVNEKCPCGCNLPVMKLHTGKVTDVVIINNGKIYSSEIFDYLNLALLDLNRQPFNQYQIIQTKPAVFTIRFVKSHDFIESDLSLFRELLIKAVKDNNVQIEFEAVNEIKPDITGKFRYFISNLNTMR